ncbi:uncharacterized protein LOC144104609 isoform X2 [Amblyomma americanum]
MPEEQRRVTGWRATHVLAYLLSLGSSIAALVCYRNMNSRLQTTVDKCLLYTKPKITSISGMCQIDYTGIEWSSDSVCNYVTFALLASFVYSIVAVWFFVMCAPSRGSELNDSIVHVWKIVAPASILSGVMALITLVMASKVSSGMNIFFNDLVIGAQKNCSTSSGWKDNTAALLFADRVPTKIFVWLVFFCWMFAALTLVVRCATAADFSDSKKEDQVTAHGAERGSHGQLGGGDSLTCTMAYESFWMRDAEVPRPPMGSFSEESQQRTWFPVTAEKERPNSTNLSVMKPRVAPHTKPPSANQAHSTPKPDCSPTELCVESSL